MRDVNREVDAHIEAYLERKTGDVQDDGLRMIILLKIQRLERGVAAERERCISVVLNGAGVAPWGWRVEVANEIKKLT